MAEVFLLLVGNIVGRPEVQKFVGSLVEATRCNPLGAAFFEGLIIELLVKMGYGGSRPDAAAQLGRSGDGGVDGVINEDRLGLIAPKQE